MSLDMLLQVLGTLEGFAAEIALVRLQWDMHADVRGDVITLDSGGTAVAPLAGEVQVVGALAANMTLADVILRGVSVSDLTAMRSGTKRQGHQRPRSNLHKVALESGSVRRSLATDRRGNRRTRWTAQPAQARSELEPAVCQRSLEELQSPTYL